MQIGDLIRILVNNPSNSALSAGEIVTIDFVGLKTIMVTGDWSLRISELGREYELVTTYIGKNTHDGSVDVYCIDVIDAHYVLKTPVSITFANSTDTWLKYNPSIIESNIVTHNTLKCKHDWRDSRSEGSTKWCAICGDRK